MGILGKIICYIMGYNWQYFEIIGNIKQQPIQNLGYIRQKLWDTLWDIFVKSYGIYFCKTMGFIQKDYEIYRAETRGYIGLRL